MLVLVGFAFLSGIITILSPCILPILPVVLSGGVSGGKARPWGIITGFVISFSFFTLALSLIVGSLGISTEVLRIVAIVILIAFGIVMLVPAFKRAFQAFATRLTSRNTSPTMTIGKQASGFPSGLVLGLSLGLVWTPCVGPIMASVITLALTSSSNFGSVIITLAYSIGTAIPMLAVMLGGRALLKKVPGLMAKMESIQKVMAVIMIAVGLMMAFGLDRMLQSAIFDTFPGYADFITSIEENELVNETLRQQETLP